MMLLSSAVDKTLSLGLCAEHPILKDANKMLFSPNPSETSGHEKAVWRSVAGNYWSLER